MLHLRSQHHNRAARVVQQAQQQRCQYLPPPTSSWPLHRASLHRIQRVQLSVRPRALPQNINDQGCTRRQALLSSGLLLGVLGLPAGKAEAGLLQFPANELHNRYYLVRTPAACASVRTAAAAATRAVSGCRSSAAGSGNRGGSRRSNKQQQRESAVQISSGNAVRLSLFLYVSRCVPVSWAYSSSMLSQQQALHLHTGGYLQCSSSISSIACRAAAAQVRAGESEMEARGKVLSNPVWKTGMVMGLSDTGKAQVGEQHRAGHRCTQQHCSIYSALVDIGAYMQQVLLVAGSAACIKQHMSVMWILPLRLGPNAPLLCLLQAVRHTIPALPAYHNLSSHTKAMHCLLLPQVVRQTVPALRALGIGSDSGAWLWPGITQNSYQTAEIAAALLGIGRSRIVPEYSFLDMRGVGAWDGMEEDAAYQQVRGWKELLLFEEQHEGGMWGARRGM